MITHHSLMNLENAQYSMIEKLNTVLTVNSEESGQSLSDKDKKRLSVCHHFINKYGDRLRTMVNDVGPVQHPPDLAQMTFYELIASSRGVVLMELLSLPEQPSPDLWAHYECWFNATKVSSFRLPKTYKILKYLKQLIGGI